MLYFGLPSVQLSAPARRNWRSCGQKESKPSSDATGSSDGAFGGSSCKSSASAGGWRQVRMVEHEEELWPQTSEFQERLKTVCGTLCVKRLYVDCRRLRWFIFCEVVGGGCSSVSGNCPLGMGRQNPLSAAANFRYPESRVLGMEPPCRRDEGETLIPPG